MALNSLGLGFVFTARDLASGQINNLARNFMGLDQAALRSNASYQRNLAVMGAGVATLGAGAATLGGAFALANQAGEFQRELARVGAIAMADADQLAQLRQAAIEAGIATQFSPQEAVQGLGELAQQGFNATESIRLLTPSLDLAAGGSIGVAEATSSVASAVRVFSLNMDEAQSVADKFLRISNTTSLAASDMQQAMGSVARGAGLTGQTIDEMLPAIGLVRNTGVEASVAAQSVSSALIFMSQRQAQFRQLGIEITDAQGNFRPFLDVVHETAGVLNERFPNAAERAATATDLFSRFGVQAYNGIANQLAAGVRDSTGKLYQGAAAVDYLRGQMQNAAGAAEEFRSRLLNTFEGQKVLLRGSMQTLGVVLGEAFIPVFRPAVEGTISLVNRLIAIFNGMPVGMRELIAHFVVGAGVLLTVAGAFLTVGAAIAIFGPFLSAAAAAATSLFVSMLPFVGLFGILAGASAMLHAAYMRNIGGIGDTFRQLWADVSIVFSAIGQILTQGFLSGDVARQFEGASAGVQDFVRTFHALYVRFQEFSAGISAGFSAAVDAMGPTIEAASHAFARLGDSMGFASDAIGGVATTRLERFAMIGAAVGSTIGDVLTWVIDLGRVIMDFAGGALDGFRAGFELSGASLDDMWSALGRVWDQFVRVGEILGLVDRGTSNSASGWATFGQIVGGVVGGIAGLLVRVIEFMFRMGEVGWNVVETLINAFKVFWHVLKFVGNSVAEVFYAIRDGFMNMIDSVVGGFARVAAMVPESLRPSWMGNIIDAGAAAETRRAERDRDRSRRFGELGTMFTTTGSELFANTPSVAQEQSRAHDARMQADAMQRAIEGTERRRSAANRATTVIQIDGREIARAVSDAGAIMSEEAFTPAANMSPAPGV